MPQKRVLSEAELVKLLDERVREYKGDITELERAIGAVFVGRQMGWKVLLLVHDRKTIKRYEETLDLEFREPNMPDVGEYAHKSVAWSAVQKVASFWRAVKGEYAGLKSVLAK
jgi:hypothetical protein